MSNTHANASKDYIFKVTVLCGTDLILADLGGIKLSSHSTIDLGAKFGIEAIKKSRSLAENIWNGNLWAWDSCGNQIGGWDLCDVENNLANSCEHTSTDMAIVCLSGCATDVISEYVGIGLSKDRKTSPLVNVFQEREASQSSIVGTWWTIAEESKDLDLYNPSINVLRSLTWGTLAELFAKHGTKLLDYVLYMTDIKTGKYYIVKFRSFEEATGNVCYIRLTLKNAGCNSECDTTSVVFGTNIPDACDTYLYNNFGVSSNIAPYLVTHGQYLCELTLSYQSASLKDGKAVNAQMAQIFSPYRLFIEINGKRKFFIPLPGGDWQGKHLDLCNPNPLNVVEFFEGRSELWNKLYQYYQKWDAEREKLYQYLLNEGCILGIYLDGEKEVNNFVNLGRVAPSYAFDAELTKELADLAKREAEEAFALGDMRASDFYNLYSTGVKFYDEFLRIIYILQSRALFSADKISVYVGCNESVETRQEAEMALPENSAYTYCQSVSNIQLTLTFSDLCKLEPVKFIDGRIWGKVTDLNGIGIPNAEVSINGGQSSTKTDDFGVYSFENLWFGDFGDVTVLAGGYEESVQYNPILTIEEPSLEVNFQLESAAPATNTISGFITSKSNGQPISLATVYAYGNDWEGNATTNDLGYYSISIPNNVAQTINIEANAVGYDWNDSNFSYDGSTDVTDANVAINRVYSVTVNVVAGGSPTDCSNTIWRLENGVRVWGIDISTYGGVSSNTAYNLLPGDYEIVIDAINNTAWQDTGRFITIVDSNLTESFDLLKAQYTVNLSTIGKGIATGSGTYDYGSRVTLTAAPNPDQLFDGWLNNEGTIFTTSNPYIIESINTNWNLTASFSDTNS